MGHMHLFVFCERGLATVCMKNKGQFSGIDSLCISSGESISNYKEKRILLSIASETEVKGRAILILNTGNILMNYLHIAS